MRLLVFASLALLAGCRGPIDLSDAGLPFPCDHTDASVQCTSGWRCGLEDHCHQIGVVGAYQCQSTTDCEGIWQCSLNGRCVDATADGLLATPQGQTLTGAPLPGASAVAAPFVVEGAYPSPDTCSGGSLDFVATVAWIDGGTLYRENYFPSGRRDSDNPVGLMCPGPIVHRTLGSAPFSGHPVGMTSSAGFVFILTDGGQLCVVPQSFSDVKVTCSDDAGMQGGLTLAGHGHLLATHDGTTLTVLDVFDGGVTHTSLMGTTIESIALEDAFGPPALYVGTLDGLRAGTVDAAGKPNLQDTCAGGVYSELKLVHPRGDYSQAPALVAIGTASPSSSAPSVLLMAPDPQTRGACPVPGPLGSTYYADEAQPCGIAQLSSLPFDVTAGPLDDGAAFLEVRFDGGLLEREIAGSLCKPANPQLPATYAGPVEKPMGSTGEGLADGRGHLWLNRYPLVPDRPFAAGAGGEANLALTYVPLDDEDPGAWAGTLPAGLETRSQAWLHGRVLSGVDGDLRLWVTELGVEDRSDPENPSLLMSFDTPSLAAPFHATEAGRDGGALVVMSSFDSLLSGVLEDGGTTLSRRLAPVPGAPIDSLAFYGEEPGYFAHGYVVATGLLVEIKGKNPLGWTAQPVDLAQLAPWRVWIDRGRGRVGATDGTVVTLPSGVQVAQPLPNGEQVLEYQQLCNNTFALTAQSLYWLAAPDAGVGQWTPLPIDAPPPYASLYVTERSLLVSSAATGAVTVLSGVQCP